MYNFMFRAGYRYRNYNIARVSFNLVLCLIDLINLAANFFKKIINAFVTKF